MSSLIIFSFETFLKIISLHTNLSECYLLDNAYIGSEEPCHTSGCQVEKIRDLHHSGHVEDEEEDEARDDIRGKNATVTIAKDAGLKFIGKRKNLLKMMIKFNSTEVSSL